MTLRFKLTLWYTLLLAILVIGFATVHYFFVKWSITEEVKSQLTNKGSEISKSISWTPAQFLISNSVVWQQLEYNAISDYSVMAQIIDWQGNIIHQSGNLAQNELVLPFHNGKSPLNQELVIESTFQDKPFYTFYKPFYQGGAFLGWVQIGMFEARITSFLQLLRTWLVFSVPFGLLVSIFFGYYLGKKALAPIESILATTAKINSSNLDIRVPSYSDQSVEIQEIATTLNSLLDRLSESFKRILDFTSDASHELLTPLTAMIGNIDVTLRRKRTEEEYDATLKKIRSESNRMMETVKSLLFIARSEPPYNKLERELTDVSSLIQEEIDNLAPMAANAHVTILYEPDPISATINAALFRQLVQNLLTNGIKYSNPNGKINVEIKSLPNDIVLSIQDEGCGIPSDAIPKLFDRFYRVDNSRQRQTGGSGLGLTIVKRIVDLHNGKVDIQSEVNKGTIFTISIPNSALVR